MNFLLTINFVHHELKIKTKIFSEKSKESFDFKTKSKYLGKCIYLEKCNDMHGGIIKRLLSVVSKLDIP